MVLSVLMLVFFCFVLGNGVDPGVSSSVYVEVDIGVGFSFHAAVVLIPAGSSTSNYQHLPPSWRDSQ